MSEWNGRAEMRDSVAHCGSVGSADCQLQCQCEWQWDAMLWIGGCAGCQSKGSIEVRVSGQWSGGSEAARPSAHPPRVCAQSASSAVPFAARALYPVERPSLLADCDGFAGCRCARPPHRTAPPAARPIHLRRSSGTAVTLRTTCNRPNGVLERVSPAMASPVWVH